MKKNVKSNVSGGKLLNNCNISLSARGGTSLIGRGINAAGSANKK